MCVANNFGRCHGWLPTKNIGREGGAKPKRGPHRLSAWAPRLKPTLWGMEMDVLIIHFAVHSHYALHQLYWLLLYALLLLYYNFFFFLKTSWLLANACTCIEHSSRRRIPSSSCKGNKKMQLAAAWMATLRLEFLAFFLLVILFNCAPGNPRLVGLGTCNGMRGEET